MGILLSSSQRPERWSYRTRPQVRSARRPESMDGVTRLRSKAGRMMLKEGKAWTAEQIAYPNLAGNKDVADRVVGFVDGVRRHYEQKTYLIRKLWHIINFLMRGNSLAQLGNLDIVHVPELYKMREQIVPRIEQALWNFDPPFRVRGRDPIDKDVEDEIMSFLLWQLGQANYKDLWQASIRSLTDYQFAMAKVTYDRRFEDRIIREIEERPVGNDVEYLIRRKMAQVLTYEGPRIKLVDPFDAIVDTEKTCVDDMAYVGDVSMTTFGELERLQQLGIYMNVAELRDKKTVGNQASDASWGKWLRSSTERFQQGTEPPRGGPQPVEVVSLCAKFDLYGDGREIESILVTAGGKCLQAIENFYDDKVRPYAIARAAMEEFEFFNVGVMDHGVGLNESLDEMRSIAFRTAKLNMSPFIVTEPGADYPETIFDLEPGTIIEGVKPTIVNISGSIRDFVDWSEILRRDMEETTGAPRIYAGQDESGTATQSVNRLREANKRTASLIRSYGGFWVRVLEIMHSMNRQFVTRKISYRVVGKAAKVLGRVYSQVSPRTFLDEVDFEFVGLQDIEKAGTRSSAMMQWMSLAAPFMQSIPDFANIPAILKRLWDTTVGDDVDDESLIRVPPMLDDLMPQEEENQLLLMGEEVAVHPADPHEDHISKILETIIPVFDNLDQHAQLATTDHLLEHISMLKREQNQMAARSAMVPTTPAPPEAMAGGTAPVRDNRPFDTGVNQTPARETPGTGTAGQVSKPGRVPSMAQDSNQGI